MSFVLFIFMIAAVAILVYTWLKYLRDPRRRLQLAHKRHEFFFYDHEQDAHKNFFITYKGVMFEGEKYIGTAESTFEVLRIAIDPKKIEKIEGLGYEDFLFIDQEINKQYPHATIQWRSPIKQLMNKKRQQRAELDQ